MGKIKADVVLFDYGNTLFMDPFDDLVEKFSKGGFYKYYNLGTHSIEDNLENFLKYWKEENSKTNWTFASHFAQEEPFISNALGRAGVPESERSELGPKILSEYRRMLNEHVLNDIDNQTFAVKDALHYLKENGKRIGVLSNDREWAPKSTLQRMGVFHLLDSYYTSESLSKKYGETLEKPSPKLFNIVCDEMGADRKKVCYVGDDPVRDMETPKKLGMSTILYKPPEKYRKSESWRNYDAKIENKPDAVIEDLREISQMRLVV